MEEMSSITAETKISLTFLYPQSKLVIFKPVLMRALGWKRFFPLYLDFFVLLCIILVLVPSFFPFFSSFILSYSKSFDRLP